MGAEIPLLKDRAVGENSAAGGTEAIDVPGVIELEPDCEWETVLIVVAVLESVSVAIDSLRVTTGDWGAECARACNSSSRCAGCDSGIN